MRFIAIAAITLLPLTFSSSTHGIAAVFDPFKRDTAVQAPGKRDLRLSFIGDIMAHDVLYNRVPYSRMYKPVAHLLQSDDLTFGNLETVVHPGLRYENYPRFNVHPEYVEAVIDAGVDVFSTANNHANDWGRQGILATQASLDELAAERGIGSSGLRLDSRDPMTFTELVIDKWSIGFIAIAGYLNSPVGRDLVYYVPHTDEKRTEEFLDLIRRMHGEYDFLIVSYHGGTEYQTEMEPLKRKFFDGMIHAGADIVWGHHPHVLQPWELVQSGGSKKIIMGSMGNFISGQTWRLIPDKPDESRVATGDSAIMKVRIGMRGGVPTVVSARAVPTSNFWHGTEYVEIDEIDNLIQRPIAPEWRKFFEQRKAFVSGIVGSPQITGFESILK